MNAHSNHSRFFLCSLTAILFCLLSAVTAAAIPVGAYRGNLQKAITALDTLMQSDENESADDYEKRLSQTVDAIRSGLPKAQMVETTAGLTSVDNGWLHEELDRLTSTKIKPSQRAEIVTSIIDRLRALAERISELQAGTGNALDESSSKERMREILSRPEYAPKGKAASAFLKLLNDFIRWLEKFLPKRTPLAQGQASSLVRVAQILVITICLIVFAYVLRIFLPHLLRRRRSKRDKSTVEPRIVLGEHLEAETSAKDLLAEADSLARSGQLRAAIRKAYIALLVELGDRKVISLAQHKTNRDYLRALSAVPLIHHSMSGLTDLFERHWYGLSQPTAADWQTFRDGYHETLKTQS